MSVISTTNSTQKDSLVRKVPNGSLNVDVVHDYTWTLSPRNTPLVSMIPFIYLQEYQMTKSMLEIGMQYYSSNVKSIANTITTGQAVQHFSNAAGSKDPAYEGLFDYDDPTGFSYTFPFYNEDYFNIANTWSAIDSIEKLPDAVRTIGAGTPLAGITNSITNIIQGGGNLAVAALGVKYPKTGFLDKPQLWESSTPLSYTIVFHLFNTINSSDIINNWQLCNHLCYQNLYAKVSFVTAYPPVFYVVKIPGQYASIGAYVSNLKITNIGNIRNMTLSNGVNANIPDAYMIAMTFTDMVMPSRNTLNLISPNGQQQTLPITTSTFTTATIQAQNLSNTVKQTVTSVFNNL